MNGSSQAKEVAENLVDKGKSFLAKAKDMKMRIKQMPREAVTKVKAQARESYNAVKEKAVQTIQAAVLLPRQAGR